MLDRLRQRIPDPNVFRIYWATLALGIAYGIAISVLGVYLDERGFAKRDIGRLAAVFAFGIVAMSLPMGALIRRFSAKATLAAAFIGYSFTVSAFPLLDDFSTIAAVRFFDGACSVGVWVSSETILLQRARREHKAFVTSLYAIAVACGYIVGPLLASAWTSRLPLAHAFWLSGVIAFGAGLYAALRIERDLPPEREPELPGAIEPGVKPSLPALLWRIKNSCFATFAYGYFQASVVLFLPLYLMESKGITKQQSIPIPAFFAAGMLLFSSYAGRLGDRIGHLAVMRVLAVIGLSTILGFVFLDAYVWMCAAVFVAGASLASISPLSLALLGVSSHEHHRTTALYNAFYATGMLLGPVASSELFESAGGGAAMLYHLAGLWAVFVAFTVGFFRDDPAALRARVERGPAIAPER
ncbi:MAG: MFS transporter [Myxococcota bacterium]|nr:MFS transporter [Myxococcota bacterium]